LHHSRSSSVVEVEYRGQFVGRYRRDESLHGLEAQVRFGDGIETPSLQGFQVMTQFSTVALFGE
jgi:hypothetical protein